MKYLLALVLLVGGCQAVQPRTLSADAFLYTFRCGVPPGEQPGNASATYTGSDQTYHNLSASGGSPSVWFMGDFTGPRKFRCRIDQLPRSFPSGFESVANADGGIEPAEETRQYVQDYLARHRDELPVAPARQPQGEKDAKPDDAGVNWK